MMLCFMSRSALEYSVLRNKTEYFVKLLINIVGDIACFIPVRTQTLFKRLNNVHHGTTSYKRLNDIVCDPGQTVERLVK